MLHLPSWLRGRPERLSLAPDKLLRGLLLAVLGRGCRRPWAARGACCVGSGEVHADRKALDGRVAEWVRRLWNMSVCLHDRKCVEAGSQMVGEAKSVRCKSPSSRCQDDVCWCAGWTALWCAPARKASWGTKLLHGGKPWTCVHLTRGRPGSGARPKQCWSACRPACPPGTAPASSAGPAAAPGKRGPSMELRCWSERTPKPAEVTGTAGLCSCAQQDQNLRKQTDPNQCPGDTASSDTAPSG